MPVVQSVIEATIQGVKTIVQPFGLHKDEGLSEGVFHPIAGKEDEQHNLCNSFVGWVDSLPIIRTESINSNRKLSQFLKLARHVYDVKKSKTGKVEPFRIASNQVNSIELDWDLIGLQHQYLVVQGKEVGNGLTVVHLCSALENFYSRHPPRRILIGELNTIQELPKLQNMEGWVSYCGWYNDMLQGAFSEFQYDAIDEYTLERYIVNYNHEVHNLYLKETRKRLLDLESLIGTGESEKKLSYRELVKYEKELIITRTHLKDLVRAQYENLNEINKIIPVIKEAHPELVPLMLVGSILERLLAFEVDGPNEEALPFVTGQMLQQLLNDEFGIISSVNCDHGIDRTNVAFAIRLATMQLRKLAAKEKIIDLAINWLEASRAVYHCLSKKGIDHLDEWILNIEDRQFQFRVRLLLLFWDLFAKNMNAFCLPITAHNTGGRTVTQIAGLFLNAEYLYIMPPFIKVAHEGEEEKIMMLRFDSSTYEPVGLTDEGSRFLLKNSYSALSL